MKQSKKTREENKSSKAKQVGKANEQSKAKQKSELQWELQSWPNKGRSISGQSEYSDSQQGLQNEFTPRRQHFSGSIIQAKLIFGLKSRDAETRLRMVKWQVMGEGC
jgi:hypothetical protein